MEQSASERYAWYVVAVLTFAYTVAFIDRQIISLLVEPIKADLQISDSQFSWLAGFAFALFYSFMGVPIARLADRYNRKYLICAGVFLWSLLTAMCGLSRTYAQLFLMRMGVGVGEAALSPAAYSMIADYFPPARVSRAIGVYVMGLYLGSGIALVAGSTVVALVSTADPVTVPFIGEIKPWQMTFPIVALPGFLVLALMMTVKEPQRSRPAGVSDNAPLQQRKFADVRRFLMRNWQFLGLLTLGFLLLGTVVSAYLIWLPETLRRTHGISITEAGFMYGVVLLLFGTTGPIFGGWLAGYLNRKCVRHGEGEIKATEWCTLAMIPLATLAPLAPSLSLAVVLIAGATFVLSAPQGLAPSILQVVCPADMRAQVTSLYILVSVLLGFTLGPVLTAGINDHLLGDESALNISLAIVTGCLLPLGLVCLRMARLRFCEQGVTQVW
ncbi:spinster family MFS transporter [Parahaliea aestuarii]|uniref:spinster family MFS transporter n=1 Tax=Parahaliea aestuarii TaxID=1852021 RepID=UPI0016505EE9|nr:MFS transporter [Parahaliea aestuarii]